MKHVFSLAGWLMLAGLPALDAADYLGADAVLQKITEQLQKAPDADKPISPVRELRRKLADFVERAPTLPPEQAAAQWLALFDVFGGLPPAALRDPEEMARVENQLSWRSFLAELPPVAAWDALLARLETRQTGNELRDKMLRLLAAILRDDLPAQRRLVTELRAFEEDPRLSVRRGEVGRALDELDGRLEKMGDAATRVAAFEKRLAKAEKSIPSALDFPTLSVPPLVKLAGPEKARALLLRVMALNMEVGFADRATHRLASQVALQSIDRLARPHWEFIEDIDDAPLYEAMAARFPKVDSQDASRRASAAAIYLLSLLADHRTKDAVAFAASQHAVLEQRVGLLSDLPTSDLVRRGLSGPILDFLRAQLEGDPALPYWKDYVALSTQTGAAEKALIFLRQMAARPDLSAKAQAVLRGPYIEALLAADEVDEAARLLRALIQKGPPGNGTADDIEGEIRKAVEAGGETKFAEEALAGSPGRRSPQAQYFDHSLLLARIGNLTGHPEWVEEGCAAAASGLQQMLNSGSSLESEYLDFSLSVGRGTEVEKMLAEDAVMAARGRMNYYLGQHVERLAVVYHLAGRHEDVLRLLEQSPFWHAGDLSGLARSEQFGVPILHVAAKALAATGRKEEARRVTDRLLEFWGSYDPGYELFLELGEEGREARLEALAREDRFEKPPLIWLARLQLEAGRWDEAEKSVRAALAIDPGSGDEKKADRLRANGVLADILEKKGDAAQAKILRGAVEGMRLARIAAECRKVGLQRRAVRTEEEALGHFADSYTIHAALAADYDLHGDVARAQPHYRRAFELMPGSFGRIESHEVCECPGIYFGEHGQEIAEQVFTRRSIEAGAPPQVFYLFAHLRRQQGRPEEAIELLRRATQLDPDYFSAWEQLAQWSFDEERIDQNTDAAALAMLRLDPLVLRHGLSFDGVRNLRALRAAILSVEKSHPSQEYGPIFLLPQAAAELDRRQKAAAQVRAEFSDSTSLEMNGRTRGLVGDLRRGFASHQALQSVATLLECLRDVQQSP